MWNIKKVTNHEYHVSEGSREEMDVEKHKQRIKIDYNILTNRPDVVTELTVINQVNDGCTWPENGYEQHQIKQIDNKEAIKSRCYTKDKRRSNSNSNWETDLRQYKN